MIDDFIGFFILMYFCTMSLVGTVSTVLFIGGWFGEYHCAEQGKIHNVESQYYSFHRECRYKTESGTWILFEEDKDV
jgi:hypothetical protein